MAKITGFLRPIVRVGGGLILGALVGVCLGALLGTGLAVFLGVL